MLRIYDIKNYASNPIMVFGATIAAIITVKSLAPAYAPTAAYATVAVGLLVMFVRTANIRRRLNDAIPPAGQQSTPVRQTAHQAPQAPSGQQASPPRRPVVDDTDV